MDKKSDNGFAVMLIISVFLIAILLFGAVTDKSAYSICQYEFCWRVDSYTKTKDGLDYIANGKKGHIIGDYSIREL